jgi:hypothetical protein
MDITNMGVVGERSAMANEPTIPQNKPQDVQHLEALVKRARQGDEAVLPELRQLLDRCPEL